MVSEAEFPGPTRVVFGENAVDQVGALVAEMGAQRAYIVTDEGVVAAGHLARLERSMSNAGVKERSFQGVHQNPDSTNVAASLSALSSLACGWCRC